MAKSNGIVNIAVDSQFSNVVCIIVWLFFPVLLIACLPSALYLRNAAFSSAITISGLLYMFYLVAIQEMIGLSFFMLDQSRKEAEYCMDNAFNTYLVYFFIPCCLQISVGAI